MPAAPQKGKRFERMVKLALLHCQPLKLRMVRGNERALPTAASVRLQMLRWIFEKHDMMIIFIMRRELLDGHPRPRDGEEGD